VTAIYLSASSAETPRARAIRDLLRSEGITVVGGGWIESVEQHGSLGLRLPQMVRERIADDWVADIRRARALLALVPDVPPEAEELEWVHRHGAMPPRHSLGLVAEVSIARALGLPVVLASKTPQERLHPAYLFAGGLVYGEDVAAAWAAIQKARRA
jgi:hypothetical protein